MGSFLKLAVASKDHVRHRLERFRQPLYSTNEMIIILWMLVALCIMVFVP